MCLNSCQTWFSLDYCCFLLIQSLQGFSGFCEKRLIFLVAVLFMNFVVKFANFCKDVADVVFRKILRRFQWFDDALPGRDLVYSI